VAQGVGPEFKPHYHKKKKKKASKIKALFLNDIIFFDTFLFILIWL
jgi:hypothetical protein